MNFLKLDDIKLLLEKCKTEKKYTRYYPLLYTAFFTGMRRGEILALTWHDVDFKHKTIRVNKSVYKNTVVDPKTLASNRKVDMTNELCQVLQEHKKNRNKVTTLVFPNKEGKFMDPDNLVERFFKSSPAIAGFFYQWHDLRHTYVSLLLAAGVPIKYIQSQVGHSSIQW
jgi:integrase